MKKWYLSLLSCVGLSFASAQTVFLAEHFDYPADSALDNRGWYVHSGTSNPILVTNGGLSWSKTNYKGSGVGNAAAVNNTGYDYNKPFNSDAKSGSVYASFLLKANASTAGYIFHFGEYSSISTPDYSKLSSAFRARTFVTPGTNATDFKMGLTFNSNTISDFSGDLTLGETYLVVLKYTFVDGADNDEVSLFVFADGDDISMEPTTPTIGPLKGSASDLNAVQCVALRQFSSSQDVVVDGIIAQDAWDLLSGPKKRTVKISVDMKNETVSSNGVHVAGSFQGWNPSATTLSQEGSTSIYSAYAEMDENALVEYKFINNNDWASGVESVPAISQKGHKNNGETNDNRWIWTGSGSDTLMLPAFVFGKSAPDGQYAVRLAVDLQKEASVSTDGVHIAGSLQGWDPSKTAMANLYNTNKIYEVILTLTDGDYEYKFVNGNAWGKDESVPSSCATNNNRGIKVSGADLEASKICFGSCDACPTAAIPKFKATFQVDMGKECDFEKVDIAGGKINGWAGGTFLSDQSGLSGDWKITKIGVGPSKGDISWFSEEINSTTRPCMQDDRVALNADGSFFNIFGAETWIEGWQLAGANGCGTPVAPFDGSTPGTWKDNGDGSFTVYGKGNHLGIPKAVNGAEISNIADTRDSLTYEYDITDNKLTAYMPIAGGAYWQFNYERINSNATVWTTTVLLDSGVEIAHKIRKIDANGNVSYEGGADRKYFVHNDTAFDVRCFGLDEPCSGATIAPSDITFQVDMSNEIPQDTVWVMGSFTSPAWQSGAIAMLPNADNADLYEVTVEKVCNEYFEYKFVNAIMSSSENGEDFPDSTDRACLKDNGLGSFNRHHTRTSSDADTLAYVYNSCAAPQSGNVTNISSEMRIAPNPASGMFTVSLGSRTIEKVIVMSLDGRTVRSENPVNNRADVNVFGLNGVYLVQITDVDGNIATQKVVLQ